MSPVCWLVFQSLPRTSAQNCKGLGTYTTSGGALVGIPWGRGRIWGSQSRLKRRPPPFALTGIGGPAHSEKPSPIASSTAPETAAPEVRASILVTMSCSSCKRWLSAGTLIVIEAVALLPVPPLVDVTGSVTLVNDPTRVPVI